MGCIEQSTATHGAKFRTGVVFGDAPAPLGAMWAKLSELEDQLAQRLAAMPPGAIVYRGTVGWTLRENDGMTELACGRRAGHELGDACSRFEASLDFVDVDEEDLRRQIDTVGDVLACVELGGQGGR